MDGSRVDQLFADAVDSQLFEQRALRAALTRVGDALESLAIEVGALRAERLAEVDKVIDELRIELARIPNALADHRRAIGADVRAALAEALAVVAGAPRATFGRAEPEPIDLTIDVQPVPALSLVSEPRATSTGGA